jgi:hypothetical protein
MSPAVRVRDDDVDVGASFCVLFLSSAVCLAVFLAFCSTYSVYSVQDKLFNWECNNAAMVNAYGLYFLWELPSLIVAARYARILQNKKRCARTRTLTYSILSTSTHTSCFRFVML